MCSPQYWTGGKFLFCLQGEDVSIGFLLPRVCTTIQLQEITELTCFANTPSGPLVTPSLQEFGTGDGHESIEVLLTNLEGFWLLGVEMVMEEEEVVEKEVDNFEVVVVTLLVGFGTGVSNKLLLPPSLQSVPPTSTSPWILHI